MKKIFCFVLIAIVASTSLFAVWKVGDIVDDFDDPTGEQFVYTLTEGTLSNSVTSRSKSCVRVRADFSASPYPVAMWTFEIHDYSWDNPVEDFYDDSSATIKIKEDDGTVTIFSRKNSQYYHGWNQLSFLDSVKFTEILSRNQNLKVSISIEKVKYVFAIDCSDFNETFAPVFDQVECKLNMWYYDGESDLSLDVYDSLKAAYKEMGIDKKFCLGAYKLYGETNWDGTDYLYYFRIDNEDFDKNKYMNIDLDISSLNKSYRTPISTVIKVSDIQEMRLVVGETGQKLISGTLSYVSSSNYTWRVQESIEDMVSLMHSGQNTYFDISLKNGKHIQIAFDGKSFAEYYEKAKQIEQY